MFRKSGRPNRDGFDAIKSLSGRDRQAMLLVFRGRQSPESRETRTTTRIRLRTDRTLQWPFMKAFRQPSRTFPRLCPPISGGRRGGYTLVEMFWIIVIFAGTRAGFIAAKGHGAGARVVGAVAGTVIGIAGLLTGMLLISAFLAVTRRRSDDHKSATGGTAELVTSDGGERLRTVTDRIASGFLILAVLSLPLWTSWASDHLVRRVYGR